MVWTLGGPLILAQERRRGSQDGPVDTAVTAISADQFTDDPYGYRDSTHNIPLAGLCLVFLRMQESAYLSQPEAVFAAATSRMAGAVIGLQVVSGYG